MKDYIKFEELSTDMKEEIEKFHTRELKKNDEVTIEDSMISWFESAFDEWVNKKYNKEKQLNKRKHFRLDVEIPIRIIETLIESTVDDVEAIDLVGNIINISKGGLYFKYKSPIEISSIIRVYIDLSSREKELTSIEALAMVVRIDRLEDDQYGIGVMFSSIYDSDKFNLELFLLRNLSDHLYLGQ